MIDHEFPVGETAQVQVYCRSGRVDVVGGSSGRVRVAVETRDPTYSAEQRGDTIVIRSERGGRANVLVELPDEGSLQVSTASAAVDVSVPLSRLDVATASGDLRFRRAGRLVVRSASGDVNGVEVTEEARCFTASGDVRIDVLGGRADLSTASGDVTVTTARGDLTVTTVSGDIRVDGLTGPRARIRSMSGDVRVGVPPRSRVDLDARSLSGTIELPEPDQPTAAPERDIALEVKLVSGDLRLERSD